MHTAYPAPEPEFDALAVVREEAAAVAQAFGIVASDDAGAALIDRLMLRLGGSYVYVPRRPPEERLRVRDEVLRRFDGTNARTLAAELGVTVRYVQRLVAGR